MRLSRIAGVAFVACVLASGSVVASDPIGVIAIVTKVQMEPNDQAAERIKLWGAFVVPDPNSNFGRQPAKKGVTYFKLPPGREAEARIEWADLKSVAGTELVVGFGSYWGTVRSPANGAYLPLDVPIYAEDAAAVPAVYPRGIGIQRLGTTGPNEVITQLRTALGLR